MRQDDADRDDSTRTEQSKQAEIIAISVAHKVRPDRTTGHGDCYAQGMAYSHRAYIAARSKPGFHARVLNDTWHLNDLLGLGRGTAVYSATHRDGTPAAIKLVTSTAVVNPAPMLGALRGLARAWAHPGAVPIHDAGAVAGRGLYLAMDLQHGETLLQHVQRMNARVEPAYAVRIISLLLDVLAVAHRNHLIHHALNPNNVFVTAEGELKLLDLGIVPVLDLGAPGLAARCGYTLGTSGFMAPEQALGLLGEVDTSSDVWAVGAILFWLLTGSPVHGRGGTTALDAVNAAGRFAPKLASVQRAVSPELCLLVDRALAFSKRERWFDAQAMQGALRQLFGPQPARLGDQPVSLPVEFRSPPADWVGRDEITRA